MAEQKSEFEWFQHGFNKIERLHDFLCNLRLQTDGQSQKSIKTHHNKLLQFVKPWMSHSYIHIMFISFISIISYLFSVWIDELIQISTRWPENQGDDMWEVHPVPWVVDTKPWGIFELNQRWRWMALYVYQWFNSMIIWWFQIEIMILLKGSQGFSIHLPHGKRTPNPQIESKSRCTARSHTFYADINS